LDPAQKNGITSESDPIASTMQALPQPALLVPKRLALPVPLQESPRPWQAWLEPLLPRAP
jgi:hypothetical protein